MGKMLAGLALGFVALGANAQVNPDVMFADGVEDCRMDKDFDLDRLADCQEVLQYQTNPGIVDTDDDGFKDGDEVLGPIPAQGHPLLDLGSMGANPRKKTILLEIDWSGNDTTNGAYGDPCSLHDHRPTANEVQELIAAYANAPNVVASGALPGIQLIIDYGQGGAFTGGNEIAIPGGVIQDDLYGIFQTYKTANFAPNRRGYFHYMISAHQYTTFSQSSGYAEVFGDDIIVSLFCYAQSGKNQVTTMMHELGHNIGLDHGGDTRCNWKPNYNSIMNHKFQFPGIDKDCNPSPDLVYDYSVGDRITIDENHVNEHLGTCGFGWAIDWDTNNSLQADLKLNLNSYDQETGQCGGTNTVLSDYDDWGNVALKVLPAPLSGGGAEPPTDSVSCPPPPQPKPFVFGAK